MNTLPKLPETFNFFQLAYVVADLDAALDHARRWMGVESFRVNREVSITTRAGIAQAHFAIAFVGSQQIELIQPAGGADGAYRDTLTAMPASPMHLHHLGHSTTDPMEWQRLQSWAAQSGLDSPVGGVFQHEGVALMHYLYLDTRAQLGHYLEFMYQTAAGAALWEGVPRHAVRMPG